MLAHEFIRNALLAGSLIALASGPIGYFVVLRSQVFAADALSHVAFTGTLAAAAAGLDLRLGLFCATVLVAVALAALGGRAPADDATIGTVFVWVLGLGVLFLDLYSSGSAGGNGTLAARTLFGSIFGLGAADARVAALIALALSAALLAICRPLLFATLDPRAARARGVPVRLLGAIFLVLLGLDAGEATQAVGALLLLGLLAAPAGAAHRLTANPYLAMALSAGIALVSVWLGIALSYEISALPPSSAIVAVATGCYGAALGARRWSARRSPIPSGV
ncbi:MAG TPA: metal ABC transporter permease [Solirubrobacteraceae bacterium]|jgi:zinc/manganese transport system permease protein